MHTMSNWKRYVLPTLGVLALIVILEPGIVLGEAKPQEDTLAAPLLMLPQTPLLKLQRPQAVFDHDLHTRSLKEAGQTECSVCHVTEEASSGVPGKKVAVFRFPKAQVNPMDRTAVMNANHRECISCHRKMSAENRKSGPDIGLCGKCHVRNPAIQKTAWSWQPTFNYVSHAQHVKAMDSYKMGPEFNTVPGLQIDPSAASEAGRCEACHHVLDEKTNKLAYKKDSANSCRACHKDQDEKNVRALKNVAHAACISCHMKAHEVARKDKSSAQKKWGPYDCKGCHGEHKKPTPEEIQQLPRLVRGQKDVMDLSFSTEADPKDVPLPPVRMKVVPFSHKLHEPRTQFCNTCHHNSLEKCINCHTLQGDPKKGGGVSYERAFHSPTSRQACNGCHNTEKHNITCAGCHHVLGDQQSQSSCRICHRGPADGRWPDSKPISDIVDTQKVPERIKIKTLQKEFEPADFQHVKIIKRLVAISNQSSLAKWFHDGSQPLVCDSCHHRTPVDAGNSFPKCISCHGRAQDTATLGKPGILAAYHRQCMECHENMRQKPLSLECVKCHAAKQQTGAQASSPRETDSRTAKQSR